MKTFFTLDSVIKMLNETFFTLDSRRILHIFITESGSETCLVGTPSTSGAGYPIAKHISNVDVACKLF